MTTLETMSPTRARILGLVLDGHRMGRRVTMNGLKWATGFSFPLTSTACNHLKQDGLIDMQKSGNGIVVTPRCVFVPAGEL